MKKRIIYKIDISSSVENEKIERKKEIIMFIITGMV